MSFFHFLIFHAAPHTPLLFCTYQIVLIALKSILMQFLFHSTELVFFHLSFLSRIL